MEMMPLSHLFWHVVNQDGGKAPIKIQLTCEHADGSALVKASPRNQHKYVVQRIKAITH